MQQNDGLIYGHFEFTSGRHGDYLVDKYAMYRNVNFVRKLCVNLADQLRNHGETVGLYAIAGTPRGGWVPAAMLAEELDVRVLYFDKEVSGRYGMKGILFDSYEDRKIILLEDVLTTGGSLATLDHAMSERAVPPSTACVLVDRSGARDLISDRLNLTLYTALTVDLDSWAPKECPLCERGMWLHKSSPDVY